MANAKIVREAPVPPPASVVLTMTTEEAEAVQAVLRRVGGDSEKSRRGLVDNVERALRRVGVEGCTDDIAPGHSLHFSRR